MRWLRYFFQARGGMVLLARNKSKLVYFQTFFVGIVERHILRSDRRSAAKGEVSLSRGAERE